MLLDLISKDNNFNSIYQRLTAKNELIVHGLTNSAKSFVIANLFKKQKKHLLYIVNNHHEAQTYYREIKNLLGEDVEVHNFLCQEISPYDQINSDVQVTSSQLKIFSTWQSDKPSLTVITFKAFSQLYIQRKLLEESGLKIKLNDEYEPLDIARKLVELGYSQQFMVENRGQFSHRGDILDVYPLQGEATRIEFFGESVDSIRTFSISSQRSIDKLDSIEIHPRYSIIRSDADALEEKLINLVKEYSSKLDEETREGLELSLSHNLSSENKTLYWEGVEYYKSHLGQGYSTLFEYLPEAENLQLVLDEWEDLLIHNQDWQNKIQNQYKDGLNTGKLLPIENDLFLESSEIVQKIKSYKRYCF